MRILQLKSRLINNSSVRKYYANVMHDRGAHMMTKELI